VHVHPRRSGSAERGPPRTLRLEVPDRLTPSGMTALWLMPPTPVAPLGNPPGVHLVARRQRGRGAWCAPDEVGQINGLARITTQTVRPG